MDPIPEVGRIPGVLTPPPDARPTRVRAWSYDADEVTEVWWEGDLREHLAALPEPSADRVLFLEVVGLQDVRFIAAVGAKYRVHTITLEDLVNTKQRPKADFFDGSDTILFRTATGDAFETRHCALLLREGLVITFQNEESSAFDAIRDRIRNRLGRVRSRKADYLAYALLDSSFDCLFPLLERCGEELDDLEDDALACEEDTPEQVHAIRRGLGRFLREMSSTRQAIAAWARNDLSELQDETIPFVRDLEDNLVHIIEQTNALRETCGHLFDLHTNAVGARMNEVMKVLTIIATFFMPLGFIAGVYGMNFNPEVSWMNMPETQWAFGYPFAVSLMIVLTLSLLVYFRHKRWL